MKTKLSPKTSIFTKVKLNVSPKLIVRTVALPLIVGIAISAVFFIGHSKQSVAGIKSSMIRTGNRGTTAIVVTRNVRTHVVPTEVKLNSALKLTKETNIADQKNDLMVWPPNPDLTNIALNLVQFDSKVNDSKIDISWTTPREKNYDFFLIERSFDGVSFEAIGIQKSAGNSDTPKEYQFTDNEPGKDTNYYRLKQFNLDGKYKYSNVIAMKTSLKDNGIGTVSAGPNPFTDAININYNSKVDGLVNVTLFDMTGKAVKMLNVEAVNGKNVYKMNNNLELPAGNYMLGIIDNNKITPLVKMVKSK